MGSHEVGADEVGRKLLALLQSISRGEIADDEFLEGARLSLKGHMLEKHWDLNLANVGALCDGIIVALYPKSEIAASIERITPDSAMKEGCDENFTEENLLNRAIGGLLADVALASPDAPIAETALRLERLLVERGEYDEFPIWTPL